MGRWLKSVMRDRNKRVLYTMWCVCVCVCVHYIGVPVIGCAPLITSENIVLTQYRIRDITMSQSSPFEDTLLTSQNSRDAVRHLVVSSLLPDISLPSLLRPPCRTTPSAHWCWTALTHGTVSSPRMNWWR